MQTIYKYALSVTDQQVIQMPSGAKMLSVQTQNGVPMLWALVESDHPSMPVTVAMSGTGHAVPRDMLAYLGTIQLAGGQLVFHVFTSAPKAAIR